MWGVGGPAATPVVARLPAYFEKPEEFNSVEQAEPSEDGREREGAEPFEQPEFVLADEVCGVEPSEVVAGRRGVGMCG